MLEQPEKLREVAWHEVFRWLVLLRCVRIALLARVMILGAFGLFATALGWQCIVWAFSASEDPVVTEWRGVASDWLWNESPEFTIVTPARSANELFASAATGLVQAPATLWLYMTRPFVDLFRSELTAPGFLCLLLCGVWELIVWGLFGGAITRIAALKFTRDEAPDLFAALRHAAGKWLSYSTPPLLALAGAAIFGVQLAVLGWIMRLSFMTMVSGLFWPFVLLLGLLMAILLIGALFGWPLMFATISVEGTDAFDALQSGYHYTFQRPLRLLWYVFLAGILAAVSMFIVKLFAASAISLGNWSVSWGLDEPTYRAIVAPRGQVEEFIDTPDVPPLAPAPLAEGELEEAPSAETAMNGEAPKELQGMESVAATAIAFWKSLLGALAAGYQAGFLWVAAVGIYLLMRKDVDGAEMDEVYVEEEQDFGLPPLADDAATGVSEVDVGEESKPGDTQQDADQPPGDVS